MITKDQAETHVVCIVCETSFDKQTESNSYQALKHFDDACICNECLRKEREGWPKPKH